MHIYDLPAFLVAVPLCGVVDRDGEIERDVYALMEADDLAGALVQSSAIRNTFRSGAWYERLRREAIKRRQPQEVSE
jgi:hypothetical protein